MKYGRRWLPALLATAAVALVPAFCGGCSHSRPSGGGVDSGGDDGDAGANDALTDDGAGNDGAAIDGRPIDATVDAAIDAPTDAPIDGNGCPTQPCSYNPQCGCAMPLVCDLDFTDLIGTSCRAVN